MWLRYFARVAEERMAEDDAVILVTHQPRWLTEWFWEETGSHNLRQLVRGSLRGRARVWLSGSLCTCHWRPLPSFLACILTAAQHFPQAKC